MTAAVLSLEDIAQRLGISYETARRWASAHKLPVFKFNGRGRWRGYEDDIDAFIKKHKNDAASWSEQMSAQAKGVTHGTHQEGQHVVDGHHGA